MRQWNNSKCTSVDMVADANPLRTVHTLPSHLAGFFFRGAKACSWLRYIEILTFFLIFIEARRILPSPRY